MQAGRSPRLWDVKNNRASALLPEAQRINLTVDKIRVGVNRRYQELMQADGYVTATKLKDAYPGISVKQETLLKLFEQYNAEFAKKVGHNEMANQKPTMVMPDAPCLPTTCNQFGHALTQHISMGLLPMPTDTTCIFFLLLHPLLTPSRQSSFQPQSVIGAFGSASYVYIRHLPSAVIRLTVGFVLP